jgi:hypothetical protein
MNDEEVLIWASKNNLIIATKIFRSSLLTPFNLPSPLFSRLPLSSLPRIF